MSEDYKDAVKNKRLEAGKLMTEDQLAQCNLAIHIAAAASGVSGAIPIPVADAVPITTAQIAMVLALGKVFEQDITEAAAKGLIGAAASTFVGRNLVKLIPIAGWIVSAAVAAGVTEAIGWTIAVDFANNARREWDRKRNAEEAAQAYAAAEKYKREARHTETDEDAEDFSE